MTLARIVTVLIFAVLAADYSHGCDLQKMSQCAQKYLDIFGLTSLTDYDKIICRSDVISYAKCTFEEGQACGTFNQDQSPLLFSYMKDIEKMCPSAGRPISQNAAEQTLPTAVIIVGLFMALLFRIFPF